ncbi:hypothetical protein FRC12_019083, partial [Ceratobasidium sp. 428]
MSLISEKRPAFSPELISYLAEHCTEPELLSLALLDRSFRACVLPILYRNIQLRAYENALAFCNTVRASMEFLGSYTRVLDIRLYEEPDVELGDLSEDEDKAERQERLMLAAANKRGDRRLGNALAAALSVMVDLAHLTLDIWREGVFGPIFTPTRLAYPFTLKSLGIQVLGQDGFMTFLQQQSHIEELEVAWGWNVNHREFRESNRCDLPPEVLPRLRNLRIESNPLVGLRLIRNRPVSTLALGVSIGHSEDPELGRLVQQGSVPLTCLRLSMSGPPQQVNLFLASLISAFDSCLHCLKDLTIVAGREGTGRDWLNDIVQLTDTELVKSKIKHFSALESFKLEVPWDAAADDEDDSQ